jgi:hypothetical protein
MKKRASGKKKIRTEILVALIGLAGVIVTAIFGSPVLVKWLERTPTPAALTEATNASPLPAVASSSPAGTLPAASLPVPSSDCQPAGITELPAQAVAIVESINGALARISLASLRYEYQTSLRLASGLKVEFNKMQRVDLVNPDFSKTFTAEITITLLDCSIHNDIINPGSDSNLTGESPLGAFQMYMLEVKSIVFEW